jgi:hypothetical protein
MLAIGTEPSGLRCSYRRSINDGDSLDDLLLVGLGARTVEVTDDGRHTGLVAHGGRQVDGLLGVILGEPVREGDESIRVSPSEPRKTQKRTTRRRATGTGARCTAQCASAEVIGIASSCSPGIQPSSPPILLVLLRRTPKIDS